jgi:hypothetical protein
MRCIIDFIKKQNILFNLFCSLEYHIINYKAKMFFVKMQNIFHNLFC